MFVGKCFGMREKKDGLELYYTTYIVCRGATVRKLLWLEAGLQKKKKPQQYQIQTLWGDFFSADRSNFNGLLGYLQDFITAIK